MKDRPVALILTRQAVPVIDRTHFASAAGLRRGAYVLSDPPAREPQLILMASGSEVSLIIEAAKKLEEQKIAVRVVSMPCWELFATQTQEYRESVLPASVRARLAVEAGATQGWHRYVGDAGDVIGIDRFGASAPGAVVMRALGLNVDNVCRRSLALLR
jgi:transketolase